jgi:hypothetical protein
MRIFIFVFLSLFFFSSLYFNYPAYKLQAELDDEVDINDLNSDKRYYELVNKRFKPDQDEFYLDSIYSLGDNNWASISRSKEIRASDLHRSALSYTVGSPLNDYLVIEEIIPSKKSVIIRDIRNENFFQLRMSYGSAKSRLIPVVNKN